MPETFVPPPQCFPLVQGGIVVGNISFGGKVLRFDTNGKEFAFEMHNWFGPCPVTPKKEEPLKGDWPKVAWDAYERWELGGKLVEGDRCLIPNWCIVCKGAGDVPTGEKYRRGSVVETCSRCRGKKIEAVPCNQPAS